MSERSVGTYDLLLYVFFLCYVYFFLPGIVSHSFCLSHCHYCHPHLSSYFVVERQDVVVMKGHLAGHQRVQGHAQRPDVGSLK